MLTLAMLDNVNNNDGVTYQAFLTVIGIMLTVFVTTLGILMSIINSRAMRMEDKMDELIRLMGGQTLVNQEFKFNFKAIFQKLNIPSLLEEVEEKQEPEVNS